MAVRRRAITDHRLAITATEPQAHRHPHALAASERLSFSRPRRWNARTRRAAWAVAVLAHAAIIAFLLWWKPKIPADEPASSEVAVVFDNGGEKQAAAPPAPRHGREAEARTPPPAAPPPPPPQAAQSQPEVHLNMPDMPFPNMQSALAPPQPEAPPQPRPQPRPTPRAQPPQKYIVMNNMSYGSPRPPAPPSTMPHAMDMSLPQTDTQAVMGQDFTVKGNIGADYMAELHKWVEDHGYYPDSAIAQGQEGNAVVEFTVDRSGHVSAVHLLQSSGSTFIDQAWFQLFADNQLPPFPPGTKSDNITVDYTGEFHLIR